MQKHTVGTLQSSVCLPASSILLVDAANSWMSLPQPAFSPKRINQSFKRASNQEGHPWMLTAGVNQRRSAVNRHHGVFPPNPPQTSQSCLFGNLRLQQHLEETTRAKAQHRHHGFPCRSLDEMETRYLWSLHACPRESNTIPTQKKTTSSSHLLLGSSSPPESGCRYRYAVFKMLWTHLTRIEQSSWCTSFAYRHSSLHDCRCNPFAQ